MDVSVAQDDEAGILRAGILARLLLAYTRIFILRFRFQDDQRLAVVTQQQKIDESLRAFLKVRTETFDVLRLQHDVRLKNDIRGTALVIEEAPASGLQQPIDFDPRRRLLA